MPRLVVFAALLLLPAVQATSQDRPDDQVPPRIEAFIERVKAGRSEAIERLMAEVAEKEATIRKRARPRDELRALADEVKGLKARIAKLEKGGFAVPELNLFSPKVGSLGTIPESVTVTVAQVIDETTMHIAPSEVRTKIDFVGVKQSQSFYTEHGERLVLKGVSTKGLADNTTFTSKQTFEVAGTDSYTTTLGAKKTVFVIEPLDIERWRPVMEARLGPAVPMVEPREWSDATGSFSITAKFASHADGKVTLIKEDCTEVVVPLAKLSKPDQDYVRNQIASRKKAD